MDFESRIVTSDFTPEDNDIENSLRPKILDDYIGQDKVKENLAVYIQAARGRGEALDHVFRTSLLPVSFIASILFNSFS